MVRQNEEIGEDGRKSKEGFLYTAQNADSYIEGEQGEEKK